MQPPFMVPNRFYGWTIFVFDNGRVLYVDVDYHRYGHNDASVDALGGLIWFDLLGNDRFYSTLQQFLPTREHLKVHAFLSFAPRHVNDFGGSTSITYSNAIYLFSIRNSNFRLEIIPMRIKETHQDEIRFPSVNVDVVSTCWSSGC